MKSHRRDNQPATSCVEALPLYHPFHATAKSQYISHKKCSNYATRMSPYGSTSTKSDTKNEKKHHEVKQKKSRKTSLQHKSSSYDDNSSYLNPPCNLLSKEENKNPNATDCNTLKTNPNLIIPENEAVKSSTVLSPNTNHPLNRDPTPKNPQKMKHTISGKDLWKKTHKRIRSIILNDLDSKNEKSENKKDYQSVLGSRSTIRLELSDLECSLPLIVYLLLGVMAYSFIFEDWPITDSLYFAVVTFTTVGYGDLAPASKSGKLFTCLFAIAGVAYLGIALGLIGSRIIETNIATMDAARNEKKKNLINIVNKTIQKNETEKKGIRAKPLSSSLTTKLKNNDIKIAQWQRLQRSIIFFILLFLGAYIIGSDRRWDWIESLYFCTITSLTIGYGDLTPDTPQSKLFSVCYILIAVSTVGHLVGCVATMVIEQKRDRFLEEMKSKELTLSDLGKMDSDGDGKVTMLDYVEFMLVTMETVDREVLDTLHRQFERLDELGKGELTKEVMKEHLSKKFKSVRHKLELSDYKKRIVRAGSVKKVKRKGGMIDENNIR